MSLCHGANGHPGNQGGVQLYDAAYAYNLCYVHVTDFRSNICTNLSFRLIGLKSSLSENIYTDDSRREADVYLEKF